jgi:hypothetical protein
MHFDLHLSAGLRERLDSLAGKMRDWEVAPRLTEDEVDRLRAAVQSFPHTLRRPADLTVGGVDGSGDFPSLTYGDSFVYFTVAQATAYRADPTCGLREVTPAVPTVFEFSWVPEAEEARAAALDDAFEKLAGAPLDEVIEGSDYRTLKSAETRRASTVTALRAGLIRPHAADAGNLGIQLRTTGEMGAALRLLRSEAHRPLRYLLIDTTFSLPLLNTPVASLFYEHLKRLCCVEARRQGTGFFALSKSHGLPSIETVEQAAREAQGLPTGENAEHWFVRLPEKRTDGWALSLTEGRRLPPPGAVSYLVRFHQTTPTLRLDMDREFWREHVRRDTEDETRERERAVFADLDYACHDQRCYGYPYPLKAGHDRASLTKAERATLRRQVIDAAVRAGMKRSLFREPAAATGHE